MSMNLAVLVGEELHRLLRPLTNIAYGREPLVELRRLLRGCGWTVIAEVQAQAVIDVIDDVVGTVETFLEDPIPDDFQEAIDRLQQITDLIENLRGLGQTLAELDNGPPPTADAVAAAFGVELYEHPDILAMMTARWGGEINAARRRMARVPVGGELVNNPVQGPPGFKIGNVFVLAGVPQIMRGMLQDVGPRLKGGAVVVSRTLKVDGSGEGAIAAPLRGRREREKPCARRQGSSGRRSPRAGRGPASGGDAVAPGLGDRSGPAWSSGHPDRVFRTWRASRRSLRPRADRG